MSYLYTIKPGDTVVVHGDSHSRDHKLCVVQRVTSTQITVLAVGGYEQVFRKVDGYLVGSKNDIRRPRIVETTAEFVELLQRRKLTNQLRIRFDAMCQKDSELLPLSKLVDIQNLLP